MASMPIKSNMRDSYSIFDVTGPILIGPSSSHTAGACRLANAARAIMHEEIMDVVFHLYGSFAQTLLGHGTDKALVGGIIGIRPDDERLIRSHLYAKEKNLSYQFVAHDSRLSSANSVRFDMTGKEGKKTSVSGVSIGGGSIAIEKINDTDLYISLKYNTLVIDHVDKPGAVLSVSKILAENNINIASLDVYRKGKHDTAYMIIEIDEDIDEAVLNKVRKLDSMRAIYIPMLY